MKENEIPIIKLSDDNFDNLLDFQLWSTQSSSDYNNDRNREYNGQSWTDDGIRGQTEVKGLTMRDIRDCLTKAILISSAEDEYLKESEFRKCWNYDGDKCYPTEYLLQKQKEGKYLSTKVKTGNWRYQDIFKIDQEQLNLGAVCQNLTCEIERMMGIFPNIPKTD